MKLYQLISFAERHIGPKKNEILTMLKELNSECLNDFVNQIIPGDIRMLKKLKLKPYSEHELKKKLENIGNKNLIWKNFIGMGFYNCFVPNAIIRNILENPGWYTSYTPYQSEISQGRLESLFNYQTMICELTGLPVSNASLLDESSAAAEALTLIYRANKDKKYLLYARCHPQTLEVVQTRAKFLDIEIVVTENFLDIPNLISNHKYGGVLLQSPNTDGLILPNLGDICSVAHRNGCLVAVGTDLLSLCVTQPLSYFDCDIAYGSCQRMGNFLGYGGPHAAFFATRREFIRQMPGRIVGMSKDACGNPAFRLMLQTREQHIKREKATSNICTAQALLANMTAMYGVYHGPSNLRNIALNIHEQARYLHQELLKNGHRIDVNYYFDTLRVYPSGIASDKIRQIASERAFNLRYFADNSIGISLDETTNISDIHALIEIFNGSSKKGEHSFQIPEESMQDQILSHQTLGLYKNTLLYPRTLTFMAQPVFNRYHSETEFIRYMKKLENRDMSLTDSMIPLGSCTLKLNATTELMPISWPCFSEIHPYAPVSQTLGFKEIIDELERDLCMITGMDNVSFHSNSGAQGEYSGLCTILSYLRAQSPRNSNRKVCFIPNSSHGTNFSSAALAGMKIIGLPTNKNGFIDIKFFREMVVKYKDELACIMITYPSTHGVFDPNIKDICKVIHEAGALVYMDGANMNAQVGLCRPGDMGADVCHLNLHKTFCIPHGGGGPGMGPIAVKAILAPFLPHLNVFSDEIMECNANKIGNTEKFGAISSSEYGSALILIIPWMYIKLMGGAALSRATQVALLNANYIMARLEPYFEIYHSDTHLNKEVGTNDTINGTSSTRSHFGTHQKFRCGHEFLLDLSALKAKYGIDPVDIAKRLLDYGFHSPTVSFPIASCLMIEPTESEGLSELDRFCEAMIAIRHEIDAISDTGPYNIKDNPIKNAPHTQHRVLTKDWILPYSRMKAAFPLPNMEGKKWPTVSRVDEIYGDQNPKCRYD